MLGISTGGVDLKKLVLRMFSDVLIHILNDSATEGSVPDP
jgi:hypothetical protein